MIRKYKVGDIVWFARFMENHPHLEKARVIDIKDNGFYVNFIRDNDACEGLIMSFVSLSHSYYCFNSELYNDKQEALSSLLENSKCIREKLVKSISNIETFIDIINNEYNNN